MKKTSENSTIYEINYNRGKGPQILIQIQGDSSDKILQLLKGMAHTIASDVSSDIVIVEGEKEENLFELKRRLNRRLTGICPVTKYAILWEANGDSEPYWN